VGGVVVGVASIGGEGRKEKEGRLTTSAENEKRRSVLIRERPHRWWVPEDAERRRLLCGC